MVLPPPTVASIGTFKQGLLPPLEGEVPLFNADVPPPFEIMIQDGERLVGARVPDYSVGRCSLTEGSNLVIRLNTYVDDGGNYSYGLINPGGTFQLDPATTPIWGKWLEGREIVFPGDAVRYQVLAVLDRDIDGVFDSMWVVQGETQLPPQQSSGVQGSDYTVLGFPNSIFFSSISTFGIFPEIWPITNRVDLDMQGDEIMGLCHAGEFLLVVGRRTVVYLLQNHGVVDDVPATGSPYSNPRYVYGCPGCQAPRSIAQLPNNTGMWLTPEGKIALATAGGVVEHPLSEYFRGWVSGRDKVNTDDLRYSHAVYVPEWQWYVLFLIEDNNVTQTSTDGGLEYWPETVAPDDFNGGVVSGSPVEIPFTSLSCNQYGHTIDRTNPLPTDYSRILILDVKRNVVYVGWGWDITCTLSQSSPCASPSILPGKIMSGDTLGYINQLFGENCYGMGGNNNRVYWPGECASDTFSVDVSELGEFFQTNALIGLTVKLHFVADDNGPAHYEDRTITSNNNNTISFTPSTTDYDSVDHVLIAPMSCGVVFNEKRTTLPSTIKSLLMDCLDTQPQQQIINVDILGASGNNNTIDFNGPTTGIEIDTVDLKQGQGDIQLPQLASKALAIGLRFFPFGAGMLQFGPVSIDQFLAPGERLRSEEK